MAETVGDEAFAPMIRGGCQGLLLNTGKWIGTVEQSKMNIYWQNVHYTWGENRNHNGVD
jgi:hypothetical protein